MKHNSILKFIFFVFICAFMASSCTKEGPMGPAGSNGTDGINGTNGTDGQDGQDGADGNATCSECHSDNQVIFARENQWAVSMHATGSAFERNAGECAECHTSQGFIANLAGTYDGVGPINNPNPQNCYTCHKIHETFTAADLELTVSKMDPITLRNTELTNNFGAGNVCASCHQARTLDPFPVPDGDSISVTSPYWGVHHGTQANALAGVGMGLFEIGEGFTNSAHASMENACVTCHMPNPYGTQAGGHTMWMDYEYHGASAVWAEGCVPCHTADEVHDMVPELQAEVQVLLDDLKTLLDAAGITNPGSDTPVVGKYSANVAGACVDYKAITEDKSLGVHNPKYIKKLIKNCIEALEAEAAV
jgi:nitrate/TMAO reductase-like tetraheme cytochrome c subunit